VSNFIINNNNNLNVGLKISATSVQFSTILGWHSQCRPSRAATWRITEIADG